MWPFKKKNEEPKVDPTLLSFRILPDCHGLNLHNAEGFKDYLRNEDTGVQLDPTKYSDLELAYMFMYLYAQNWLAENLKSPMFVETHSFPEHGEIRYDRAWNAPFIKEASTLGFDVLPATEEELVDMYMNYVYGTRMMEELEAMAEANPRSIAHPQLSDPDNKFKE